MEEEEEVEAATELVSREVRRKKIVDAAALEKALEIAKEIEVPAEVLLKESTLEAAQKVIELSRNLQQLVVTDASLNDAGESQKKKATYSEDAALEASRGSTTSASLSTFVTTSSDMDDIPLDRVYANLQKSISPSSSTKHKRKPYNDTFVPMYPYVEERIHDMQQRTINACVRLPADHPLQPPMIEPLQLIPVDAEVVGDQTGPESTNHEV